VQVEPGYGSGSKVVGSCPLDIETNEREYLGKTAEQVIAALLILLRLKNEEIESSPLLKQLETRFELGRQDDNGNRFVVEGDLSGGEARRKLREYEARGHKQTYWIRQLENDGEKQ